jgi:hypothetical protein
MNDTIHIAEAQRVVAALGFWPSFHDAEIVKFSVERAVPVEAGSAVARMVVHVRQYATIGEGTSQYQRILVKSVLIHFAFIDVNDLELSNFNHQNVIGAIEVAQLEGAESLLAVEIESVWGLGASILCSTVAVEAVEVLLNAAA